MYIVAPQSGLAAHSIANSAYSSHHWPSGDGTPYGIESHNDDLAWSSQGSGYGYDRLSQPRESGNPALPLPYSANSSEFFRDTAGRPAHTVLAFGFGGSIAVIKPPSSQSLHQTSSSKIEVHKLSDLSSPSPGLEFHGVLENRSKTDIFNWIDERISNCESEEPYGTNAKAIPLLWEVLKIAFEHHGKLRTSLGLQSEGNGPESAVCQAILMASSSNCTQQQHCLQTMPNSESLQATSIKVKSLLLSGKTEQALQCAQDGQSWGLALVLASQLGHKCFSDTISRMAYHQLTPGPLRTFSLLMSGQTTDVFGENGNPDSSQGSNILDYWHEHLSLMATNRASGNDEAIIRLGDALWSQKGQVAAAHLCYLLVDQNCEAFFSDGRIRLIGADHWMYPTTFFTPLAFKRTELFEYVKTKGNSQFSLAPFQPYKLVYATMLVEIGQTEEALRYVRSVLTTLKQVNKNSVLEALATDLENRIVQNLQDGRSTYTKFAGRILSNTLSYVMNSLPARYNSSTSIPSEEEQATNSKVPARSVSEPDLSRRADEKPPNGFLRRAGSSVFSRAASFVSRGKAPNVDEDSIRFDGACIESVAKTTPGVNPAPAQKNPPKPRTSDTGLYVQCSDYYSRCMNSLNKDGSHLVRSLVSPQLPPLMKMSGRKSPIQRVEV